LPVLLAQLYSFSLVASLLAQEDGNLENLLLDENVLLKMLKPIDGEEPK